MLDQDVQSRVDAYRGNPQALQQKYSVSKDLLDLMALQKLTKEKESAARELQMAMAAQQGQSPGTIRDQLQQKALGMTKMELEQQQSKLLAQKQQEQQQQLQRLTQSGIAQNAAPNMEAAPGFASGGIIAFAGPDGSEVPFANPISDVNSAREKVRRGEPLTEREENALRDAERARIKAFGPNENEIRSPTQAPTPLPDALIKQAEKRIPLQNAQGIVGNAGVSSVPGYAGPNPLDAERALSRGTQLPPNAPPAYPMPGMTPAEAIQEAKLRAGILTPLMQKPSPAPTAPVRSVGVGVGGSGGGGGGGLGAITPPKIDLSNPPNSPEDMAFVQSARTAALNASKQDPAAIERAREQAKTELSLTPQERAKMEANLAAREAMSREQMDPERLARSRLIQSLAGAAGRSTAGSALAGFALTGENVAAAQDAARRAHMLENQGYGEKIMGLDMAARKGGVEAAREEAKLQAERERQGISSLGTLGSAAENRRSARETDYSQRQIEEAKMANAINLHRIDREGSLEVAKIQAQAHADLAAATREATSESKRQEAIARFMAAQTNAEKVLDSRYSVQIAAAEKRISEARVMKQPTQQDEAKLELLIAGRERDRQKILSQTQNALTQIGAGGAGGTWGPVTVKPSK